MDFGPFDTSRPMRKPDIARMQMTSHDAPVMTDSLASRDGSDTDESSERALHA
jgi:hypothetical protein